MDGKQSETVTSKQGHEASIGESLMAARERRGLSREGVVARTHIPMHYLRMLEDGDYRLVSDQLYLLPFLRKYASFLEIDQEETAMRLVREVLRVDNNPPAVRMDEPLDRVRRHRRRNWSTPAICSGLIAVIIGAHIAQSRQNEADSTALPIAHSSPAAPAMPSAPASTAITQSPPDKTMVVPVVVPDEPPQLAGVKSPSARRALTPANRQGPRGTFNSTIHD